MNQLKIALIDSGVDIEDENIFGEYIIDTKLQLGKESIDDEQGHGTFVLKSMRSCLGENIKNVQIYPIKIFDDKYYTNLEKLLYVLEKLLYTDIDIINLSCSYEGFNSIELKKLINKLFKNGKIVVMSKNNDYNYFDISNNYSDVILVEGDNTITNDTIIKTGSCVKANGNIYIYRYKNRFDFFGKNSRACSIVSANISNIFIEKKLDLQNIKKELIINDRNIKNTNTIKYNHIINKNNAIDDFNNKCKSEISHEMISVINMFSENNISKSFINKYGIRNNITGIGMHNHIYFIECIEKIFNINILYEGMPFCRISSFSSIEKIVLENLYKRRK